MIPNSHTIRAGTCNQHTRGKRKSTGHVVKRTHGFLLMFADMSAMKIRSTTEKKKTKLTTGSGDNELPGHWSTKLHLAVLSDRTGNFSFRYEWPAFFLTLYIFSEPGNLILRTLQVSSKRALGTKEIHGAWRKIRIWSPPHLLCGKCSACKRISRVSILT